MMACGSALMVNLRRLHNHLHPDPSVEAADNSAENFILSSLAHFRHTIAAFWTFLRHSCSLPLPHYTHLANHLLLTDGCR
jgi:hypothetical protein